MANTEIKDIILRSPLLSKEQKKSLLKSISQKTEKELVELAVLLQKYEVEFFEKYTKAGGNPDAIKKFFIQKKIYLESFNG